MLGQPLHHIGVQLVHLYTRGVNPFAPGIKKCYVQFLQGFINNLGFHGKI